MRSFPSHLLALVLVWGPACAIANADGGQLRALERHGEFQLAVFTSPNPLRAGPVDVSVLIQNATTGQSIAEGELTVAVALTPRDNAQFPIRVAATSAEATNKLLRAASIDVPAAGRWDVRVECHMPDVSMPEVVAFTIDAAPPLPPWLSVWPWFTWPIGAVVLFGIHRVLVARRDARHLNVTK
jgi:hypothetical protein